MAVFSLAVVVTALGAAGCSSSSSPSAASTCDMTAPVSFRNEVAPAFIASGCSDANVCHGQMNNVEEEDLFLGDMEGGTDPDVIYSQLVGVPSKENPSMNRVTAGDTSKSYLWHKLEGDQNSNPAVASGCAMTTCTNCSMATPCGAAMPDDGAPLASPMGGEPANFCTIASWISQGAKNN
jgi:hypothetical protein